MPVSRQIRVESASMGPARTFTGEASPHQAGRRGLGSRRLAPTASAPPSGRFRSLQGPATTRRQTGHSPSGSRSQPERVFSRDHVSTKCLSSFELTATSKTARH